MRARRYSFRVGQVKCAVLLDGAFVMGREGIVRRFPDATEAEYEQVYAGVGLSLDEAASSFNILLAEIGAELVLVDSGEGGKPKGGYLPESLRLGGLEPEAITLVVITHTHGDHVLGLLSAENEPVFPNASYVISKEEMGFWQARLGADAAEQRAIITMMEEKGLRLIDMAEPILPGLSAVSLPGHTPGQIGVRIESDGETLIHLADTLHSPMQFAHPEWSPSFDADSRLSVPTRRAALGRAADEGRLTLFYHLPFPGLGRVSRAEQGFTWRPLAIAPTSVIPP